MKVAFHMGAWGTDHIFQALDAIRTTGIHAVEVFADIATVYDGKPQEFAFFLQKARMGLVGAYGGGAFTEEEFRETDVESARTVSRWLKRAGGSVLILQGGERSERSRDDIRASALTANMIGRVCRQEGVQFCYQPHMGTPVFEEEEIASFLKDTDPAAVGLCVDTAHLGEAKIDLLQFVVRHADRIKVIHLRDLRAKPVFVGGIFADVGKGTLALAPFMGALKTADYHGWIVGFADNRAVDPQQSARDFVQYAKQNLRLTL